jgi:hypothetical protein
MHPIQETLVTIGSLIIGIAALSVILSPKATTTKVIQATASGFSNALAVAQSPVTGYAVNIDTSYPDSNSFAGLPHLN